MNRRIRTLGAGALVIAAALTGAPTDALAGAPTSATAVARTGGRDDDCGAQLDRAVHRYLETTDRRDAKAFERLLAPTYTVVLPGGPVFAGKAAGSSFIDGFFARTDWTQTFRVTDQTRLGCRSAVTVFDSTYTDEDGAVPLVIALGWTRIDDRWLVELDQNTVKG